MKKTLEPQPNFETLKRAFYQAFIVTNNMPGERVATHLMKSTVHNLDFRGFHTKLTEFKADFNKWLNGLDIRQAGELINVLIAEKKDVAGWMKRKQFVIDYNERGALDLIRTEAN